MDTIEKGKAFVELLGSLASCATWNWRRRPCCGSTVTSTWGNYRCHPWHLHGQREMVVARHRRRVAYSYPGTWYTCSSGLTRVRGSRNSAGQTQGVLRSLSFSLACYRSHEVRPELSPKFSECVSGDLARGGSIPL